MTLETDGRTVAGVEKELEDIMGRKARVYFFLHHDSTDLKYYCV
jgi:hypothetical protein